MKKGFTLAEVLITLGIIGVVAALVMPSLIADYKKKALVAQLQKSVNTWQNGLKLMMVTEGVDDITDSEICQTPEMADYYSQDHEYKESDAVLKKYFKIISTPNDMVWYKAVHGDDDGDGWEHPIGFYIADGSGVDLAIYCRVGDVTNPNAKGAIGIDVNGKKGPNTHGRDFFSFLIDSKGNLIPRGSRQHADLTVNESNYWKNNPRLCGTPGSSNVSMALGDGCAARIIENGWVMDY